MIRESELLFSEVMGGDLSLLNFIEADFTFINECLARHYGITGDQGRAVSRDVNLPDQQRAGGLITQASILTVTSNPTRNSPVKRGKWVLEQLLGTPPPPPPPNVPTLPGRAEGAHGRNRASAMEQHRTRQAARSATASSTLSDFASKFRRDRRLARQGRRSGRRFVGNAAVGRVIPWSRRAEVSPQSAHGSVRTLRHRKVADLRPRARTGGADRCAVDEVVKTLEADHYRFSTLIMAIIKSDPFQKRREPE